MKNLRKPVSIAFIFVLIYSATNDFLSDSHGSYMIGKSFYYAIVTISIIYIYLVFINKRGISRIVGSIIILLYILSFFATYYASKNYHIEIGFYSYIFSFVLFLISMILKDNHETKKDNSDKDVLEDNKKEDSIYIIGNYVYGIDSEDDISNKPCSLVYTEDNNLLLIVATETKTLKHKLIINNIHKIEVNKKMLMEQIDIRDEDHTFANTMLIDTLLGAAPSMLYFASKVNNDVKINSKVDYKQLFEINISYNNGEKNKKLLIRTKVDPASFFNRLSDKYKEIN